MLLVIHRRRNKCKEKKEEEIQTRKNSPRIKRKKKEEKETKLVEKRKSYIFIPLHISLYAFFSPDRRRKKNINKYLINSRKKFYERHGKNKRQTQSK